MEGIRNFEILDELGKINFIRERYYRIGVLLEGYFWAISHGELDRHPTHELYGERTTMRMLLENIIHLTQEEFVNLINLTNPTRLQNFHDIFGEEFDNFTQVFARFRDFFITLNDFYYNLRVNPTEVRDVLPVPPGQMPEEGWVFHYLILNDTPAAMDALVNILYLNADDESDESDEDDLPFNHEHLHDVFENYNPDELVDVVPPGDPVVAQQVPRRRSRRMQKEEAHFAEGLQPGVGINPITLARRPAGIRGPLVNDIPISLDEARGILQYITTSGQRPGEYRSITGIPLTEETVQEIRNYVNLMNLPYTTGGKKRTRKTKSRKTKSRKTKSRKTKSRKTKI
uniref:Uncharacterized protein n=1 Tax=viral metagenome TaxID=1070528 RepID=A0A6C0DA72_9ZZZZ